jgi:hypothetical protein
MHVCGSWNSLLSRRTVRRLCVRRDRTTGSDRAGRRRTAGARRPVGGRWRSTRMEPRRQRTVLRRPRGRFESSIRTPSPGWAAGVRQGAASPRAAGRQRPLGHAVRCGARWVTHILPGPPPGSIAIRNWDRTGLACADEVAACHRRNREKCEDLGKWSNSAAIEPAHGTKWERSAHLSWVRARARQEALLARVQQRIAGSRLRFPEAFAWGQSR